ncbi:MAG TPA: single-stranded DNA-binding protein [Spirochaetota bacterium]|nr:single-stranded DNA-binding protein [Spirochaetota bacterium]
MASDLNRVILVGRLTRDPELRYTPAGMPVASFSIANNRTYSTGGEKKEQVSYFDCVAWSKMGEIITEYCKKGKQIAVEGRLQQRRWEDQDGNKKNKIEIVVENFQFLSGGRSQDDDYQSEPAQGQSYSPSEQGKKPAQNYEDNPFSDDDIPF